MTKGAITWLDIKDAPPDEWVLVYCDDDGRREVAMFRHDKGLTTWFASGGHRFINRPSHFAYINAPDSKQPEPLKTLKDQGCPECGCDVEYTPIYHESTQEFWLDGVCTNHNCEHQTDIVPGTWERKEG